MFSSGVFSSLRCAALILLSHSSTNWRIYGAKGESVSFGDVKGAGRRGTYRLLVLDAKAVKLCNLVLVLLGLGLEELGREVVLHLDGVSPRA